MIVSEHISYKRLQIGDTVTVLDLGNYKTDREVPFKGTLFAITGQYRHPNLWVRDNEGNEWEIYDFQVYELNDPEEFKDFWETPELLEKLRVLSQTN